jgi:serine/threonine-protein kinase RsbW
MALSQPGNSAETDPVVAQTGVGAHHSKTGKTSGRVNSRSRRELFLQLGLRSNPEALCLVRAALERATEVMRFPEPDSRAIVRSVDEALANVIRHAYKGRKGLPIEVVCSRLWNARRGDAPKGLEILLIDSGIAADPKKLKGRPLDEVRPGGLGIHFMKQSMDIVEFHRKSGKNLLRMVKYLTSRKSEVRAQGEE